MSLAKVIRNRRRELGISQDKLASFLGYDGQFISNIERGVCGMPRKKLKKLCRVLFLDQNLVYATLMESEGIEIRKALGMK
jgi:transcriptional regulator with XRE-family HTH domain